MFRSFNFLRVQIEFFFINVNIDLLLLCIHLLFCMYSKNLLYDIKFFSLPALLINKYSVIDFIE